MPSPMYVILYISFKLFVIKFNSALYKKIREDFYTDF